MKAERGPLAEVRHRDELRARLEARTFDRSPEGYRLWRAVERWLSKTAVEEAADGE